MSDPDDERALEATEEQLTVLRRMGVEETELDGLSYADADEWIAELRAASEDERRARWQ